MDTIRVNGKTVYDVKVGAWINNNDYYGTYEIVDVDANGNCFLEVTAKPVIWENVESDNYILGDALLDFNKNELAHAIAYEHGDASNEVIMHYDGVNYKAFYK